LPPQCGNRVLLSTHPKAKNPSLQRRTSPIGLARSVEQDAQKLMARLTELTDLLEKRERRLGILISRKMDSETQK